VLKSADQLRRLADTPLARQDYSPLGAARFLTIAPDALAQVAGAADRDRLNGFISALPCPVIGIAPDRDNAFPDVACDAVVSSEAELAAVAVNIERSPLAAATLVQVLRTTATMPIAEALTVESLAYATLQAGPEFRRWLEAYRPAERPGEAGPPVLIEREDERLTIVLNRPASRNAVSVKMRDALCEALELVLADPTIGAVSVSGAGRCFSIGGDLAEFGSVPDPATGHAIRAIRLPARLLTDCAGRVEFQLHGACIGAGIEMPAFAGQVVAKTRSFFQLPEIAFGLIPGAGGCVSIPRRIGRQRTAYMALSGRRISAPTALRWGLVDALAD
jgi:enoyl-CoA hydratase